MTGDGGPGAVRLRRRPPLPEEELQALFESSGPGPQCDFEPVLARSFTWVAAYAPDDALVGFVNVAWDGGVHFFLLDTTVHPEWRRAGIGTALVREAIEACRGEGEGLHVDADEVLMSDFYGPCGFEPTPAGLVRLR